MRWPIMKYILLCRRFYPFCHPEIWHLSLQVLLYQSIALVDPFYFHFYVVHRYDQRCSTQEAAHTYTIPAVFLCSIKKFYERAFSLVLRSHSRTGLVPNYFVNHFWIRGSGWDCQKTAKYRWLKYLQHSFLLVTSLTFVFAIRGPCEMARLVFCFICKFCSLIHILLAVVENLRLLQSMEAIANPNLAIFYLSVYYVSLASQNALHVWFVPELKNSPNISRLFCIGFRYCKVISDSYLLTD